MSKLLKKAHVSYLLMPHQSTPAVLMLSKKTKRPFSLLLLEEVRELINHTHCPLLLLQAPSRKLHMSRTDVEK
jgi:hypothetical protein